MAEVRKYLLDLTKATLPSWWPNYAPKQILVEQGCHMKDLDVSSEERTKDWYQRMWWHLQGRLIKAGMPPASFDMPIGFDRASMPKGAKLIEMQQ